ncbi:MAG: type II toxin-antitoxin system Phd/YefM family antitoxin [Deltaproteobacteria bacterium]|nr:type II toxin-antitoxin system Phd/YefM family antitoxin [Deltaproteobacteria bacterium]
MDDSSIEPITVFKTRSAQLVRRARQERKPILITQNGKATAVLQDIDSFREQRQALLLLRFMVQGDQELKRGKGVSAARATARLRRKLAELARE